MPEPLRFDLCRQVIQFRSLCRCCFAVLLLSVASLSFAGSVAKDPGVRQ